MIVALIALVVALGGVGYATIPDSSGTIRACYLDRYTRTRPVFRVIDPTQGQECRGDEIPLEWKDLVGAAAGGDLVGTYPNPTIGVGRVDSEKVANESLTSDDIASQSVRGNEVVDESLTSADIANQSLVGNDVLDESLTGLDINESTLATVYNADNLDGFDSAQLNSNTCPSGFYTLVSPLCWQTTDIGGVTLAGAANRCRIQGGRLPLLSEFMALMQSGVSVGNLAQDWTGSSAGDDNTLYINNATNAENPDGARANSSTGFVRCIRDPINALGSP
jgi:hypothetical protein